MQDDLRYPIGKYELQPFSEEQKKKWLLDIQYLPSDIENAVNNLDEAQLQTPYRDGGWTVHQLVHHIADSHMNAYVRFKLGLTEQNPAIKPYEEAEWAKLDDVKALPINISITLLFALHERWYTAIKNLTEEQWMRTVFHPEHKREMTLWHLLGMYSWHSRHHTQHILSLRERMQW